MVVSIPRTERVLGPHRPRVTEQLESLDPVYRERFWGCDVSKSLDGIGDTWMTSADMAVSDPAPPISEHEVRLDRVGAVKLSIQHMVGGGNRSTGFMIAR